MTKLLITGASGYLGACLLRAATAGRAWDVTGTYFSRPIVPGGARALPLDLTEACVDEDPTSCLPQITPLWGGYSPPTPNATTKRSSATCHHVSAKYVSPENSEYTRMLAIIAGIIGIPLMMGQMATAPAP